MKNNITFTSSINNSIMKKLRDYSDKYKLPKNKIIENALTNYFDSFKKAEYTRSFQKENDEPENFTLAEANLDDFMKMIDENK